MTSKRNEKKAKVNLVRIVSLALAGLMIGSVVLSVVLGGGGY